MKRTLPVPFKPPTYRSEAFNCPLCGAYAHQHWAETHIHLSPPQGWSIVSGLEISGCGHCQQEAVWLNHQILYPDFGTAPLPNQDLSADIRTDYEEARSILARSPRGAAALLRLAIQKLCKELGKSGKDLNQDIAALVRVGLPVEVQRALDAVRVIGNEAVHPGQMDVSDNPKIAAALFGLVNFIVEKMISEPKAIDQIYELLPPDKLAQIQKRDNG
jgi:Domain of unknown function (DUF4145)